MTLTPSVCVCMCACACVRQKYVTQLTLPQYRRLSDRWWLESDMLERYHHDTIVSLQNVILLTNHVSITVRHQ